MADFCLCKQNLSEAKLKIYGLIALAVESSRQPSIDCVAWLFVVRHAYEICNEKEQAKQGKIKEKCVHLRRNRVPGSIMELNSVLKEKNLKQSWILNGIKGEVSPEQDPAQLNFQCVKRN